MSKQEKSVKSGFVIKLSSETVQKLNKEEKEDKSKTNDAPSIKQSDKVDDEKEINKNLEQNNVAPPIKQPDKALVDDVKEINKNLEQSNVEDEEHSKNAPQSEPESSKDLSVVSNKTYVKENINASSDSSTEASNKAWGDYAPYITYEDEKPIYTDPTSQQKYTWNQSTNAWDLMTNQNAASEKIYSYENDTHIYTEADGSKFFWDEEKKAWIPKVDDDFLAMYQMSYGFVDNTKQDKKDKEEPTVKQDQKEQLGVKRKSEPQWFEPSADTNTKVYVSNLPQDLTEEEFVDFMQKCGLVERDIVNHKWKVKLYTDKEHNCLKGDALCTYIKVESVDLALKLLDGSDFKGNKIKVERAHFQLKGDYNPALKPKKKKKKELEKLKKMQQKLFDWRPEKFIGERSKHERVVIVKNLFHPTDFDKEVQLILDYQQDLREECTKCGEVRKVVIYDKHPEGVAQVTMKEPEQADAVVALINGRWFGKRQIKAEIWDGRTKYRIAETDSEISKRINNWDKFLEGEEGKGEKENLSQTDISISKEATTSVTLDKKDDENCEKKEDIPKVEDPETG